MSTTYGRLLVPAVSLLLFAVPCSADVAPESALLVHVQPVSSGSEWCLSPPIFRCDQVVRSTPQEGQLEFLLFFMTAQVGSGDCLEYLHTVITWPSAWELVGVEQCSLSDVVGLEDESGSLRSDGTTLEIGLSWSGYPLAGWYSVVPVARLVKNVVGPGRLNFVGLCEAVLRADCEGPTFVTHPVQVYAEAGMCGHLASCNFRDEHCEPVFHDSELVLTAPTGGADDSTVLFHFDLYGCSFAVDTHAPWCAASVELDWPTSRLHVTADATGLPPSTYETTIELYNSYFGIGRCLPVTFIVDGSIATSARSWGRVKTLYR